MEIVVAAMLVVGCVLVGLWLVAAWFLCAAVEEPEESEPTHPEGRS